MLKTTEWIVTTSDLQENPGAVLKNARQRPLIITEEGRPAAYVVSVELFDLLFERLLEAEQLELSKGIEEGEQQFAAGDFVTLADAMRAAEAKWGSVEAP
jgi:prevent-host-death family protein